METKKIGHRLRVSMESISGTHDWWAFPAPRWEKVPV